jgi:uncharacterized membrane protein YhaH (DUF805 family)
MMPVYVKRLHDLDRSGWAVLILFIPFANILALLLIGVMPGENCSNRFGEVPGKLKYERGDIQ